MKKSVVLVLFSMFTASCASISDKPDTEYDSPRGAKELADCISGYWIAHGKPANSSPHEGGYLTAINADAGWTIAIVKTTPLPGGGSKLRFFRSGLPVPASITDGVEKCKAQK